MALSAAPALATTPAWFPHDDNPENWTTVDVNNESGNPCSTDAEEPQCSFAPWTDWWAFSEKLTLNSEPGFHYETYCRGALTGDIGADGSVEVTDVTLEMGASGFSCNYAWEPQSLPWSAQICTHVNYPDEAWIRMPVHFGQTEGVAFGRVRGESQKVDFGGIYSDGTFYQVESPEGWVYEVGQEVGFWLTNEVEVVSDDEEAPCSWPELS